jgi:hypothetical protein
MLFILQVNMLCDLKCGLFWRKFHRLLRRIYTVLLQVVILCRSMSCALDLWCHSTLKILCWLFYLDDLSVGDIRVLKSPTTTVLWSVCVFKSNSVCLMKLGTPTLNAYKESITSSSWCIGLFISMKWPSLFILTNLGLKSLHLLLPVLGSH